MRRFVVLIGLALLAVAAGAVPAYATTADGQPVIAVLDSGINEHHHAFDSGQVVAWWDFVKDGAPKAGQSWDPKRAPYDDLGHGTGTAAMAAGRQVDTRQSPSAAPGTRLAIGKVLDENDSATGDLATAVRWAVHTAHADVINISIGFIEPIPGYAALATESKAFEEARRAGVLIVVANGNGTGNTGLVPGDGASTPYASSRDVLAVGASRISDGLTFSYQPEVTASARVVVPVNTDNDGVVQLAGTSFASPFVAGFASRLVGAGCAAGRKIDVARIERLVKYSAEDTVVPPSSEGYGEISAGRLPAALAHARAGTLPARPDPDVSGTYVERVAGGERDLNAGRVPGTAESDPRPRACA